MVLDSICDTTQKFTLDVVSCLERPLANILNAEYLGYGNIFILYSKMEHLYYKNSRISVKDILNNCFNIKVNDTDFLSYKKIKQKIKSLNPIIVGVDLYYLYYSEYYLKKHWPHWILIKGYDESSDVLYILDNEPFRIFESQYQDLRITYSLIKKACIGFKKNFGIANSVITLDVSGMSCNDICSMRIKTVSRYISILKHEMKVPVQIKLIDEFRKLNDMHDYTSVGIYDELQKKIINANKYHMVICNEISEWISSNYDDAYKLKEVGVKLKDLWNGYTIRGIIDIKNNVYCGDSIKWMQNVAELHEELVKLLIRVNENISNDINNDCNEENSLNIKKYECVVNAENNSDGILKCHGNEYIFCFNSAKTYNWWSEDHAPKVILSSEEMNEEGRCIRYKVMPIHKDKGIHYQIGIFIREDNNIRWMDGNYLCSVDEENNMVISKVGETEEVGQKCSDEDELCVYVDDERIRFGVNKDEYINYTLEKNFNGAGRIQMGIACKTWGRGGRLTLKISVMDEY